MKSRITKLLFISLFFSAKMSPAAEMKEEENLPIGTAICENKTLEEIRSLVKIVLVLMKNVATMALQH